jgi:hypothetical protein
MSLHPITREPPAREHETLATFLSREHAHLEHLYQQLLDAMAASSPDVRALWNELSDRLHAHMEAEERYLLPSFARVDRDEARALLRDHAYIRDQLLELGVAVDLHQLSFVHSHELIARLRAHAIREDRLMYRWADVTLSDALVRATRKHVRR